MKRIRVAVIGVGYLGRFHAQKYAGLETVDLVGVVDIDARRAQAVAYEVGCPAFSRIEEIREGLDAVSVAVPTSVHAEVAIPLLEQGIAVLLEKPMSASIEEGRRIIAAARSGGAVLQVGHLERFNPALLSLKDRIDRPMFIEAHRISPFRERGIDVDVLLDLMIHDIDIILSLVNSPITSVEAVGVPVLTQEVDIANARLRFESGCIANVTASRVSADTMRKIRIFQPDAYISIDYAKRAVDVYTLGEGREILHDHLSISEADALQAEVHAFVEALRGKLSVVVDGEAGLRALEVAYRIKDAMIIPER